jgi:hypothetical protein
MVALVAITAAQVSVDSQVALDPAAVPLVLADSRVAEVEAGEEQVVDEVAERAEDEGVAVLRTRIGAGPSTDNSPASATAGARDPNTPARFSST